MNELKYRPRPGVVMSMICGKMFLVPTRKAAEEGGLFMLRLTILSAVIWEALSRGKSWEVICEAVGALQHKEASEVRDTVYNCVSMLAEKGFLIAEDEDVHE